MSAESTGERKRKREDAKEAKDSEKRMHDFIKMHLPSLYTPFVYFTKFGGDASTALQGPMIQKFPHRFNTVVPQGDFRFKDFQQKELFYEDLQIEDESVETFRSLFYAVEMGIDLVIKTSNGFLGGRYRALSGEYLVGRGVALKIMTPPDAKAFLKSFMKVLTKERVESMNSASVMEVSNLLFSVIYRNDEPLAAAQEVMETMLTSEKAIEFLMKKDTDLAMPLQKQKNNKSLLKSTATLVVGAGSPLELLALLKKAGYTRDSIIRFLAMSSDQSLPYRPNGGTKHFNKEGVALATVELGTLADTDQIFTIESFVNIGELRRIERTTHVFTEMPYRLSGKSAKGADQRALLNKDPVFGSLKPAEYFLKLASLNMDVAVPDAQEVVIVDAEEEVEPAAAGSDVTMVNPFAA